MPVKGFFANGESTKPVCQQVGFSVETLDAGKCLRLSTCRCCKFVSLARGWCALLRGAGLGLVGGDTAIFSVACRLPCTSFGSMASSSQYPPKRSINIHFASGPNFAFKVLHNEESAKGCARRNAAPRNAGVQSGGRPKEPRLRTYLARLPVAGTPGHLMEVLGLGRVMGRG